MSVQAGGRAEEHRFFSALSIIILAMAVFGFARTYLLVPVLGLPEGTLPFTTLVHVHAVLSFGWCVLFVVQACLVAAGQTARHRRLGVLSVWWFGAWVVSGPFVATASVARYGSTAEDLAFLAVSGGNILAYTLLFGGALWWRRRPEIHKRLMVLGMVAMLSAPFGRVLNLPYQFDHVVGPGVVVAALVGWDLRALKRVHPVTAVGGAGVLLWQLAPNAYMHSDWWLATARWLVATFAGGVVVTGR